MFYLDGVSLNKVKKEFEQELLGKKVGKISQETEYSVTLGFGKSVLVFSCASSFPIAYISQEKSQKLDINFNFLLSLRKYFSNGSLIKIEQLGYDRILIFHFKKMNELGEMRTYKLYFEMMGKHSNLFITDEENKILDLMKRFSIEENRLRTLISGANYEQPITSEKKKLEELKESEFMNLKSQELYKSVEGIGKLLSNKICNFKELEKVMSDNISYKIYLKSEKIVLVTVLDILVPKEYDKEINFESFGEMIDFYLKKSSLNSAVEILKNKIKNTVSKKIKRIEKILVNIEKDNVEKENFNRYKEIGDVLAANIYSMTKYQNSVEVYDFYKNDMVSIELDSKGTPQKNIDNYYKKYNKLKRGLESNKTRKIDVEAEMNYLKSVLSFSENLPTVENLKEIIEELEKEGYLKKDEKKSSKVKKSQKKLVKGSFLEKEGYTFIYGKNNLENEFVTFKLGEKEDYWFHVKDIPGSHVILKCPKHMINHEILEEGAELAVKYSSGKPGDKLIVDYTQKRNVTKPNKAKPGFVIYKNHKEITVVKGE
ncbi:MAG: Rqc2 family fibronectin-binding protein [Fusobacteriaceae bacterium]